MAYYPKSQIRTNLYTQGEYRLVTTKEEYSGYYYEVSSGKKYTGKNPGDGPNIKLISVELDSIDPKLSFSNSNQLRTIEIYGQNQSGLDYDIIEDFPHTSPLDITFYTNPNESKPRVIPFPQIPIPTEKDYEVGKFLRYFTKKNNELKYMEIGKEVFEKLLSRQRTIAWDLYTPISIIWTLTGDQDEVFLTNKNIVALSENKNILYGFTQWFNEDFLKYYKALEIEENLFTDGTEFINRRTKLAYKGSYHIHPEKGPMVGAKHIKRKHDYLDPVDMSPNLIVDPIPAPTPTYSSGGGSVSSGGGGYSGGGGGY